MNLSTKQAIIVAVASATQTLPEQAAQVVSVSQFAGVAAAVAGDPTTATTSYTVQASAPAAAGEVQFTGTANAPSNELVFDAALTAGGLVIVEYVPTWAVPASI